MGHLFILYDPRCGVCTQLKDWLLQQPVYVPLHLIALRSEEARKRFPNADFAADELAVVSDTGQVWLGDRAWITCLWALRDYRHWAQRLASPELLPFARQAFLALSKHRFGLSRLLGLQSEEDAKRYLSGIPIPPCEVD